MRFNKQELIALASQSSNNFDREGVLVLKEKQDGFFRRSEGTSVRWFRLRGNLLFYLKGPEPWYEPMGVIVLGRHKIHVQEQDDNGHWPFQIVWDNGVCYKMATFHESERTIWLKSIQLAPYDSISAQMVALKEMLHKIRPIIDIAAYRVQKGIITDMNEVPLYELALSCDNLLCDTLGRPPSPMAVVYLKFPKGPMVRYGSTEVVESSSNPSFSKTILFRASDGLTEDAIVKIVIYDVKEVVSDTMVPVGFTALLLSVMQEAQRLRVALQSQNKETKGFVTISGWSLEPASSGASPSHNDNSIDISQKLLCHRRSHSLPPRLGLKLKFPSYGSLFRQNFLNSYQVTYRFHSGLGGDIAVHEIMAEPKICYLLPLQLLDVFIAREKESLEGLLLLGEEVGPWRARRSQLAAVHVALLRRYARARRCLQTMDDVYFKPSARKGDPDLEFAPTNLHLQRMWVYNDTLNKTGFHDVITAGAFTAHAHLSSKTSGTVRSVQDCEPCSGRAAPQSFEAERHKLAAAGALARGLEGDARELAAQARAGARDRVDRAIASLNSKLKSIASMWEPNVIEHALTSVGWTQFDDSLDFDALWSNIVRVRDNLVSLHSPGADAASGSSSEPSPTADQPAISLSVPDIANQIDQSASLQFDNDYFNVDRRAANHSFRSVRSPIRTNDKSGSFELSKARAGSLRHDYKSTASLEQVSYKCLMDGQRKKSLEAGIESLALNGDSVDSMLKLENQLYLNGIVTNLYRARDEFVEAALAEVNGSDACGGGVCARAEALAAAARAPARWLELSAAALRVRREPPARAARRAADQYAADVCFAQALTTATAGVACWLWSAARAARALAAGLGPLCAFEGLLSLHAAERRMWADTLAAVERLQAVVFTLHRAADCQSATPYVTGPRDNLTVHIPVSDTLYSKFNSKEVSFTVTAVLFNVGVNDKASLAAALGEAGPQQRANCDALARLAAYHHAYCKLFPPDPASARASSRTKPLEEVMENLRIVVQKKVPKNVELLQLVALATRLMNGIRFTSCKSAKDRTGMSVTLEQCSILCSEYHLAEHEAQKALDVMRREGCRRENTAKNIGTRKYAFNKKQVMALPEQYRPPAGSYGSSHT